MELSVLVIRADGSFSESLRESGHEIISIELIKTEPVSDLSEFIRLLRSIDQYDGIFLTSPAAASIFLDKLRSENRKFHGKVYALGDRVRAMFDGSGLNICSNVQANTAEDLIESFDKAEFEEKKLLFIRGDRSLGTIPKMLSGISEIDEIVVYRTGNIDNDVALINELKARLRSNSIDWVCFFSPSGVDGFVDQFGFEPLEIIQAAAIGDTTANRLKEVGFTVAYVSERANAEDFATGFVANLKSIE